MTATTQPGRIAVLGATGFIGRALCKSAADAGYGVLGAARRPAEVTGADRVVALDVAGESPEAVAELLAAEQVTAVVNAAGGMWGLTDEEMVRANVGLVANLVAAVAQLPGRVRLVHLGTVHEYGLTPIGETMREDRKAEPVMAYGELKLRCTEAVLAAAADGRIDGGVLRVGNVVGAGQPAHSLLGVIAAKLRAAHDAGERAVLELAPLTARRDFVDLDDTVDAVLAAIAAPETGWLVNIGRGAGVSARETVELLVAASGVPTEVVDLPAGGPPEPDWQCMDVTYARELFGWQAHRGLDASMAALWEACLRA